MRKLSCLILAFALGFGGLGVPAVASQGDIGAIYRPTGHDGPLTIVGALGLPYIARDVCGCVVAQGHVTSNNFCVAAHDCGSLESGVALFLSVGGTELALTIDVWNWE